MRREDFSEAQRRHLVGSGGHIAFVPPPLPPTLDLSPGLVGRLSRADRAIGQLAGLGLRLPNPYLLIDPFVRREAVLSSRIEGTQATLSDLVLYEAQPAAKAGDDGDDVGEVANYVRALRAGLAPERTLPIGRHLFERLHAVLLGGVRGNEARPGQFRREQNWIGPAGIALADAVHVPPPPREMKVALRDLESYLDDAEKRDLPPLIRLALVHYQFEAIHPFLDGNGRIGRLLVTLLLVEEGLLPQPLLYLSAYLERRRAEYYERLLAVSRRGDWDGWVGFFLDGVAEQALDAVDRAQALFELQAAFHSRLHVVRATALPLRLADHLFERPALSVADAARALGVTRRAAALNVQKLVEAGILSEVTGKDRSRVYLAREIVELLTRERVRADAGAAGRAQGR